MLLAFMKGSETPLTVFMVKGRIPMAMARYITVSGEMVVVMEKVSKHGRTAIIM